MEIIQNRNVYKYRDSYHGFILKPQVTGNNINNSIEGVYRFLDCNYFLVNSQEIGFSNNVDTYYKYRL